MPRIVPAPPLDELESFVKRTLSLKREALSELSTGDLLNVAGAAAALPTTPVNYCVDQQNSKQVCFTAAAGYSRCVCPTEG
jgi:hypothetical protein